MQNLQPAVWQGDGWPRGAVDHPMLQASRAQAVAVAGESSAEVSITTAEGDRVTLSASTRVQAAAGSYEALGRQGGVRRAEAVRAAASSAEQAFAVTVEGELDERERKQVRKVLKTLFKMMKKFVSGKWDDGLEKARKLGRLEEISSVSARFEVGVAAVKASAAEVQAAVPQQPAADADAPGGRQPAGPSREPAEEAAEQMLAAVEDAGIDAARIRKPLKKMLARMMRDLAHQGAHGFRRLRRLQSLAAALQRQLAAPGDKATEQAAPPGVAAAGEGQGAGRFMAFERQQVELFAVNLSFDFSYAAGQVTAGTREAAAES